MHLTLAEQFSLSAEKWYEFSGFHDFYKDFPTESALENVGKAARALGRTGFPSLGTMLCSGLVRSVRVREKGKTFRSRVLSILALSVRGGKFFSFLDLYLLPKWCCD